MPYAESVQIYAYFHTTVNLLQINNCVFPLRVDCDKIMHMCAEILMCQVHEPTGECIGQVSKLKMQVHYFVTILEHKVNTQLLI